MADMLVAHYKHVNKMSLDMPSYPMFIISRLRYQYHCCYLVPLPLVPRTYPRINNLWGAGGVQMGCRSYRIPDTDTFVTRTPILLYSDTLVPRY